MEPENSWKNSSVSVTALELLTDLESPGISKDLSKVVPVLRSLLWSLLLSWPLEVPEDLLPVLRSLLVMLFCLLAVSVKPSLLVEESLLALFLVYPLDFSEPEVKLLVLDCSLVSVLLLDLVLLFEVPTEAEAEKPIALKPTVADALTSSVWLEDCSLLVDDVWVSLLDLSVL